MWYHLHTYHIYGLGLTSVRSIYHTSAAGFVSRLITQLSSERKGADDHCNAIRGDDQTYIVDSLYWLL